MKLKKITPLIIAFSISALSFKPACKKKSYFEGEIIYQIDYKPYSTAFRAERIQELIGSKMVLTFKKGNYKKAYFSPDGKLLQTRILNLKDKKSYLIPSDSDTIYWLDITLNASQTDFKELNDTLIMNHPCKSLQTRTVVTLESTQGSTMELEGIYRYAQDLPINPKWYRDYKEGNYQEMVAIAKGIALQEINKGVYWEQTLTAITIRPREVKELELDLQIADRPTKEI